MVMPGNVTDSWTACLRSFCADIRMSAALLRSAAESMGFLVWCHPCPGRSAARSDALQNRDRYKVGTCKGPGSAVHRFTLHRIRDTRLSMLQLGINFEARLRLLGDLVNRHAGGKLDQGHAGACLAVDGEHREIGDHHVDHAGAGE